ncbi:hypothetical protein AOLI_G00302860 [Acnodon oligacanthus]
MTWSLGLGSRRCRGGAAGKWTDRGWSREAEGTVLFSEANCFDQSSLAEVHLSHPSQDETLWHKSKRLSRGQCGNLTVSKIRAPSSCHLLGLDRVSGTE